ncbi:pisatin demethylase [Pleomassaria siparia CBS 279.74]|uniref:Pisatin demethylase n=1 Tax=Pleomassaria siparia CBS 279.74 TaxID=1314801 RepID=A0A6G1KI43_9PLEO|nr:pisatin demethylase [Pleomassaria siparia CBS 279.74]
MTAVSSILLSLFSLYPALTLLSALVVYITTTRIQQYRRLSHIPGPAGTGISWMWNSRAVISGKAYKYYADATERYGAIARIAPNHLITSSPELWAHINAVRSPYKRAEWFYHAARFEPGKDNVFTECDTATHDNRRKKLAAGYAGKENPTLEPSIDGNVADFIHLIRTKYAAPASSAHATLPMDMATKMQYFSMDVISEVALGAAFGNLKANADVNDHLKALEEGLRINNKSFGLGTSWIRGVPILGKAISPSETDERGYGRMMAEARKSIVARKLKGTDERSDMLASFIRHGVSGDDLFQEIFETLLAGSDTTSASLRVIVLYILSHPRVYAKLQAEIDATVKARTAAPTSSDIIPDAEVRKLPYLGVVVREAMRVHPPVVCLFSRVVPKGGDVVTVEGKDVFLPGDTMIGCSAWGMHRNNKTLYGADADVFRPERWFVDESIPEEKDRLARMYKTNDLLFGYGRWVCLGRVVALIEIHKAIFELLRNFDFAITNPHEPWTLFETMGLFAIGDMYVNVTERS